MPDQRAVETGLRTDPTRLLKLGILKIVRAIRANRSGRNNSFTQREMKKHEEESQGRGARVLHGVFLCFLAAVVMSYGWGYRGVVGHEGGAMVPGAMLGLALCLGSGRLDWHRRAAVAGLFGAVGWAWGGSLSYMEHTFYVTSDSFPDVAYGYAMLFFLGGLWAGIGGAILGLALTLPRSRLQQLARPFVAVCAVFLATYLYFVFDPELRDAYERFTVDYFHDGDWLAALTVLIVSGLYWLLRRDDRSATSLFFWCAVAWWVGYLGFTKLGGLELAPPYRSESWGGVTGILAVLMVYLVRERNRAALMLCLYGLVGGGIAFVLAVFIRHPIWVSWGPFAQWGKQLPQWKIAEESFGFLMGLAIAFGAVRLIRGGLAPAEEDEPRKPLDLFAVFVILVALMWVNLRRAPMAWIDRYHIVSDKPVAGMTPWIWYTLGGALLSALALYVLELYRRDTLVIVPRTPYGKGALVLILLMWVTVIGAFVQDLPALGSEGELFVNLGFLTLASIATWMLLSQHDTALHATVPVTATVAPSDARWKVGLPYALACACVPAVVLVVSGLSMAMQDGPHPAARKRFRPDAYWRQQAEIMGVWHPIGLARDMTGTGLRSEGLDIQRLVLKPDRSVIVTMQDGTEVADTHTLRYWNLFMHLEWYAKMPHHPERGSVPLTIREGRLYVPWPPYGVANGYCVFEKLKEE